MIRKGIGQIEDFARRETLSGKGEHALDETLTVFFIFDRIELPQGFIKVPLCHAVTRLQ